uniref:Putative type I phosphodiesterase/nucleotide pyrophosphatase n=1 Tax=uncultured bacterium RM57 TaxID=561246 RepID=C8XTA2_9BACT|nr:putative type I phosphodiesterase/nucleotide pyrophosphatase [uncultured bacterium RM57]
MKTFHGTLLAIAALLCLSSAPPAGASAYDAKPKLVVVLVLDQFRGDYLDRYRADFKTPHGFNLFLEHGAYFPECYYEYANTMTAPGHSTIGTGAYTNGHNIAVNDWWDLSRSTSHTVSSVEDERYPLVGASSAAELGASPRNELASTLGDEVVLSTGGEAKLFGVSLKDRAAILTSGHASQGAYWINHATGHFETSTYWRSDLPEWVKAFNASGRAEAARREANVPSGDFYDKVGASPAGVSYELDFTKALVEAEGLGRHKVTDVLTVSISSTDILGHEVGPDAPEQRAMIDAIDVDLNNFFNWLGVHVDGGLDNVWVALTGDHGVAPSPSVAAKEGMPAAAFSGEALNDEINRELNAQLSPAQAEKFVLGGELPYIQLDSRAFAAAKMNEADAEKLVAQLAPGAMARIEAGLASKPPDSRALRPAVLRHVYTRTQIAAGDVPETEMGKLILHSYSTNGGWWVMVTPGMYEMTGHEKSGTSHYTPYSYDRHVPLAFFGNAFVPGTYLDRVAPVDIAATFAALLRVNQPSACVGHVLTQALRRNASGETIGSGKAR